VATLVVDGVVVIDIALNSLEKLGGNRTISLKPDSERLEVAIWPVS
jgi:hypothetical protein